MQQTYNAQDMDRKEGSNPELHLDYVKPRRVGTITMGLVLIIVGGLLYIPSGGMKLTLQ